MSIKKLSYRMKNNKIGIVLITSFLLLSGINFEYSIISISKEGERLEDSSLLIMVNPIVIDGNTGWLNTVANENWVTLEDGVYIIKNLVIQGSDRVSCILIKNSDVPFRIENCRLYNAGGPVFGYSGLKLDNVSNGQIVRNIIINNHDNGIILHKSDNIIFKDKGCLSFSFKKFLESIQMTQMAGHLSRIFFSCLKVVHINYTII